MQYSRTDNGEQTVLHIEGTLDASAAPELRSVVDALVSEKRKDVVLQLASLSSIDSAGMGVIVSLAQRVRAIGGRVRIDGIGDQPRSIFRLMRYEHLFPE